MKNKSSYTSYGWKNKTPSNNEGFTLLEVLAALTLMGLIMLTVFLAFQNTYTIWERSHNQGETERITRLITRRLENVLGSVYLYPYRDRKITLLTGDYQGFSLPVYSEEGLGRAEFRLIENSLIYRLENLRNSEIKSEELLVTKLQTMEFSYLDQAGVWRDYWREDYYPRLVSIRNIRLDSKEGEDDLPPIILPLLVGTEYEK